MKKILIIFGTRPEAIKLAPVIEKCKRVKSFQTIVCSTGQHREMLRQVLDIFNITVDHDLDLMKPDQDLFDITSGALQKLKDYFTRISPDLVIVQGDTTTAFASALAAYYLKIKVAHVEAALRSNNIFSPYPEEANRRFISTLADFNFAPTTFAAKNLYKEQTRRESVYITGNTVVDALLKVKKILNRKSVSTKINQALIRQFKVDTNHRKFILITLHRREKFGQEFRRVLGTIVKLAKQYPHYNFVYPVHLNPNVKQPVNEHLLGFDNIVLIPPVDYLTFAYLMRQCHFIISDSGGIQEECHTFGKPILVLREVTERMEAVKAGYAYLLGSDETKILRTFRQVDDRLRAGYNYFRQPNPYGDGTAAKQIVNILKRSL